MASLVVIGASQGGVEALHRMVGKLPAEFPAPILVVVHIGSGPSMLPSILNDLHRLPASHAKTGDRIRPGHIYVAPPDCHLLVTDGELELLRGPRENWARPAIDPLFRSAAHAYGPDVIGIILTGGLNDGTAGLYEIKRRGGIAIVQEPASAAAPSMPRSALENVAVDYCPPLSEIPDLLVRLTRRTKRDEGQQAPRERVMDQLEAPMQRPTAQTCPECGGALREKEVGTLTQFRCHIGHVMTAEVLAAAQLETIEHSLSAILRLLNERADLCRDLSRKAHEKGNHAEEEEWNAASEQAAARETAIRQMVEAQWRHPERQSRLDKLEPAS